MTIKQQGGIFGRNPTFNTATVDNDFRVNGDLGIGQDASFPLDILGSSFVGIHYTRTGTSNPAIRLSNATTGTLAQIEGNNSGELIFKNGAGSLSESGRFNSSGNLAFPSGNGIDFSATAGTGTSELFDDYEEGTWTPTIGGSSSAGTYTYSTQVGYYTKIGNQVTAWFNIRVSGISSAGSGTLQVKGLPFSVNASFSGGVSFLGIDGLANDRRTAGLLPSAGNNYASAIRGYGSTASAVGLPITDLDGDGNEDILATLIYWV